ncbi:hypothetical protein Pint_04274 [Pistacia integerrima]|uniref:Uncharacterized protein n=1 Tax=Pistacia integerrima TaxID=434235 RepID=A0ACC0Z3F3_9ROSI|nr:hypothetical protein Pint_04274 [Pistacia integerrima]
MSCQVSEFVYYTIKMQSNSLIHAQQIFILAYGGIISFHIYTGDSKRLGMSYHLETVADEIGEEIDKAQIDGEYRDDSDGDLYSISLEIFKLLISEEY